MARTKEFDPDVALRAALDLFWRQGYEATSLQDLVDHLGIGRASIYATFGSKDELYRQALKRYSGELGLRYLDLLSGPSPLAAVRELVASVALEAITDPKGCLITNTAVEGPPIDGIEVLVDRGFNGLQAMLAGALVRAQDAGELAADKDPQALARFLVTFMQGLRVMAHRPDEHRIRDAVDQALTLLD
jgi:TetR/AcrR family transcriptional regulator, transcriptional repressor for nem operon